MVMAAYGDSDQLNQAIQLGADPTARDEFGFNALHCACRAGNTDTFAVLKDIEGLDVDDITRSGQTPIMLAIGTRQKDIIEAALEASANVFLKDCLEKTPVDHAQLMNDENQQVIVDMIRAAEEQWRAQVPEAELTSA